MSTELTTPIKIEIPGIGTIESADLYLKSEADAVIAELRARISAIQSDKMQLEDENRELRKENEDLKNELYTVKTYAAMDTRWRKCSEELPPTDGSYMCAYKNKNKDDGVLFVDEAVWDGEKWSSKFDFWEDIIYWQFKPKAPEVK